MLQHVSEKGVASTSATDKGQQGGRKGASTGLTYPEHPTKLLNEWEFRDHFHISNGVFMHLVDGGLVSTDKQSQIVICFSKELFNVGLYFIISSLFRQFLHFMKIPPAFLYPNAVRVLIGCSILDMLFRLDLFLLEIFFIYTVKMNEKGILSLSTHIPSLHLVTGLSDSTKGATKGHVIVSGSWVSLLEHPGQEFE